MTDGVVFHPDACREPKEAHVIAANHEHRNRLHRENDCHEDGDSPDLPVGVFYPYRGVVLSSGGEWIEKPDASVEDRKWDEIVRPLNESREFAVAMNAKSRLMNRNRNDRRIGHNLDLLFNPRCHHGAHLDPLEAHVILKDSIEMAAELARQFVEDKRRRGEDRAALVSALAEEFAIPETYAEFQLLVLDLLKTYPKDVVLEGIAKNASNAALPPPPKRVAPRDERVKPPESAKPPESPATGS